MKRFFFVLSGAVILGVTAYFLLGFAADWYGRR
jgi:hypothetical protein